MDLFLGILGASGGGTWYGTSAKPERHFTKGMFGKPWLKRKALYNFEPQMWLEMITSRDAKIRMTKKRIEFKGGSRHDRNRHNRRNRQNRHGRLLILYFVDQATGGKVLSRTAKTVKTAKTVMKATPLKPNPPFSVILTKVLVSKTQHYRTLWRGTCRNDPSPSPVLCPSLYRTEPLGGQVGKEARKGAKGARRKNDA